MNADITTQTLKDAAATLAAARLTIGALRHYAPDDTLACVNYVICSIAQLQRELLDTDVSPEGDGKSDITAREDIQMAVNILCERDLQKYESDRAPF